MRTLDPWQPSTSLNGGQASWSHKQARARLLLSPRPLPLEMDVSDMHRCAERPSGRTRFGLAISNCILNSAAVISNCTVRDFIDYRSKRGAKKRKATALILGTGEGHTKGHHYSMEQQLL